MTPVMTANSMSASASASNSASVYSSKPQTPIGTSSIYSKPISNSTAGSSLASYGYSSYGTLSTAASNSNPPGCSGSASIYPEDGPKYSSKIKSPIFYLNGLFNRSHYYSMNI